MPEPKGYIFDADASQRIATVTKYVESNGISLGDGSSANLNSGAQCIFAKLTSQHSTNKWIYAWSQYRPTGTSYESVSGGLSGTTTARPAIATDTGATTLVNAYVVLVRGIYNSGSTKDPAWYIVSTAPANPMLAVTVTKTSGVAGSSSASCTWVYTVKNLAGTSIGTGLTPQVGRITNCEYAAPTDNSPGMAYYSGSTLTLYSVAQEIPVCDSVTVVTDYKVDGASMKLQKKTRSLLVLESGTESGWTDVHAGTDECDD